VTCQKGFYAPPEFELSSFEKFPASIRPSCGIASSAGESVRCHPHRGWHINRFFNMDSTGETSIFPAGLKYSLQTFVTI
jgi:hypothetical protein